MSRLKNKNILIIIFLILVSFFAFGCKEENPVQDIYFSSEDFQDQIVLLAGQTFDVADYVVVEPSYATNKSYDLISSDESVLKVQDKKIKAVKAGSVYVKIVSKDNASKQDMILVTVEDTVTHLTAPTNLTYNAQNQTIGFSIVNNASGYILKINDTEIDMGNSNVYYLKNHASAFDKVLEISVKAVSPSYSYAFEDSEYSNEISIYQASGFSNISMFNGELLFERLKEDNVVDVYINNTLFMDNVSGNSLNDFKNLDASYAGQNIKVNLVSRAKDEVISELDGVEDYPHVSEEISVNVLAEPEIIMNSSIISWMNVSGVEEYDIYVNGDKKVEKTKNNFYDIQSFVASLEPSATNYSIKVKSLLPAGSVNTAITSKESVIQFNRFETPILSVSGSEVCWSEIENVVTYNVEILKEDVTIEKFDTPNPRVSLEKYTSGEQYAIKVKANGAKVSDVNYLASNTIEKLVTKKDAATLEVNNYILTVSGLNSGDRCLIEFDINNANADGCKVYREEKIASSDGKITLLLVNDGRDSSSLSGVVPVFNYSPGEHIIRVANLGDNSSSVNSTTVEYSFTQLEVLTSASISNNTISVGTRSEANAEANFKFTTTGLADLEGVDSVTYSTTEPGVNFLNAGSYETKIYALGNGSTVFSYKDAYGADAPVATKSFSVLDVPMAEVKNSALNELVFAKNAAANDFKLYDVTSGSLVDTEKIYAEKDATNNYFEFDAFTGTRKFKVQAIGNGTDKFNSNYSTNEIIVNKLEADVLMFDNTENIFTIDKNASTEDGARDGHVLTCNGGIVEGYNFSDAYSFDEATETFYFTLTTIATNSYNGQFYLNSDPKSLELTRIGNETEIKVEDNKLIIDPTSDDEYAIDVCIKFSNNDEVTLRSNVAGEAVEGDFTLPYTFDEGKYIINLLDGEHNLRDSRFGIGSFNVQVKYFAPHKTEESDTEIASSFTDWQEGLNVTKLSNGSTAYVNANNILKIQSTHSKAYFIKLKFESLSTAFECELAANEFWQVTNGAYTLGYEYDEDTDIYTVTLEEDFLTELGTNYRIHVKYSENSSNTEGYTDSEWLLVAEVSKCVAPNISYNYLNDSITISTGDVSSLIGDKDCKILLEVKTTKTTITVDFETDTYYKEASESVEIPATSLLGYSNSNKVQTTVTAKFIINYTGCVGSKCYYKDSDTTSVIVETLAPPKNVQQLLGSSIQWENHDSNPTSNIKYSVKISYDGDGEGSKDYYTTEDELQYLNEGGEYTPYNDLIESTTIKFPYGYNLGESDQVNFGAGTYKVSVKAYYTNSSLTANSEYSTAVEFTLLPAPEAKVSSTGDSLKSCTNISWDGIAGADKYTVTVYNSSGSVIQRVENITKTTTTYTYNGTETGVLKFTVQAHSEKANVLSSKESDSCLYAYKMNKATKAWVDDGVLYFKASLLANNIKVTLSPSSGGTPIEVIQSNSDIFDMVAAVAESAGLSDWKTVTDSYDTSTLNSVLYLALGGSVEFDNLDGLDTTIIYAVSGFDLLDDTNYYVNIDLFGTDNSNFGVLDAGTSQVLLEVYQTADAGLTVEDGAVKFSHEKSDETSTGFNYNFTNSTVNYFWYDLVVYKVSISHSEGTTNLYAIDETTFNKLKGNLTRNTDYIEYTDKGDLCAVVKHPSENAGMFVAFNVYKSNTIDFRKNGIYYCGLDEVDTLDIKLLADSEYFIVEVTTLGGDSYTYNNPANPDVGYVSSKVKKEKEILKFKNPTNIGTKEGYLKFENKEINIDGTNNYPIYKLSYKPSGVAEENVCYLYDNNNVTETQAKVIVERLYSASVADDATYYELTNKDGNNWLFDFSGVINTANPVYNVYEIKIQTLVGPATGSEVDYRIHAGEPQAATVIYNPVNGIIFEDASESVIMKSDGIFKIILSAKDSTNKNYILNYEVTINDGTKDYVYQINQNSDGVEYIESESYQYMQNTGTRGVFRYSIPHEITTSEGLLTLSSGIDYTIKVKPLGDNSNVVNGKYCDPLQFELFAIPTDYSIQEGKVTWNMGGAATLNGAILKMVFNTGATKIIHISGADIKVKLGQFNDYLYHYYEIKDYYAGFGAPEQITENNTYSIYLSIKDPAADDPLLNSPFVKVAEGVGRLPKVSNVITENGALKWDYDLTGYTGINLGDVIFKVEIGSEECIVDDLGNLTALLGKIAGLDAGEYAVSITAIGYGNYITSIKYVAPEVFVKLPAVDVNSIQFEGRKIKWAAVTDAENYKVVITYGADSVNSVVSDCEYTVPNEVEGTFSVTIYSLGAAENATFYGDFNKSYIETAVAVPKPVTNIERVGGNFAIKITVDESDIVSGDKIVVAYKIDGVCEEGIINFESGKYEYEFMFSKIGTYTNISASIKRDGTINSIVCNYSGSDIEFNLYASGSGTESDPYIIEDSTQFFNIEQFATINKWFELGADITLGKDEVNARLGTSRPALIDADFNGTLNGNGNSIILGDDEGANFKLEIQNKTSFALFKKLTSGATIKNLNIGYSGKPTIIENSFANSTNDMVKLSVVAVNVDGSTIQNVKMQSFKFELTGGAETKFKGGFKISGFVSDMKGGSITDCTLASFSVDVYKEFNGDTFIAGFVTTATENVNISGINSEGNEGAVIGGISLPTGCCLTRFGGVVSNLDNSTISNVKVKVEVENFYARNLGGIVGYVNNSAKIENSEVIGTINYTEKTGFVFNVGGVAGYVFGSTIESSGSDLTLAVADGEDLITIGGVAGCLQEGTLTYCFMRGNKQDLTSENTIGICGKLVGTNNTISYSREK